MPGAERGALLAANCVTKPLLSAQVFCGPWLSLYRAEGVPAKLGECGRLGGQE